MNKTGTILALCLGASVAALATGVAKGRTPTPTPTATAPSTPSPQQVSTFSGSCWLNAKACSGLTMTARIAGTVCATTDKGLSPPSTGRAIYTLSVPSQDILPGCGYEGATVEFFVGEQRVARSGVWHAGSRQSVNFIAGYPFALHGTLFSSALRAQILVPYVGDKACGYANGLEGGAFETVTYSAQQEPGYGVEGSEITFKLLDARGNVIAVAREKGVWHAWDGISDYPLLHLTMVPVTTPGVTLGSVGDVPSQGTEGRWADISMALAALGLAGIAAGVALRRRATP